MNITYRQWKTEDAEQVRHILHETWLDAYAPFIPEEDLIGYLDVHYSIDSIKKFLEDPNIVGFIAEADCVAVGCVKTHYNKEEGRLYVQQLYILPKYQRFGIGRHLMELSAERAKSLGLDRVWLGVMIKNQQAVAWYKKMGYEIIEITPFTMGKTTVDHYIGYVHIDRILKNMKIKDFLSSKVYGIFNSESSIGALPKLCLDLIDRQKKDWSLLADNYNMFQQVHVREVNCNGFNVNVQWNPKRIVKYKRQRRSKVDRRTRVLSMS